MLEKPESLLLHTDKACAATRAVPSSVDDPQSDSLLSGSRSGASDKMNTSFQLRHRYQQAQGTMQAGREAIEAAIKPSIATFTDQIKPSFTQLTDQAYEALTPLRERSASLAMHMRAKLERQLDAVRASELAPTSATTFNVALFLLFAPGLIYFLVFDNTFASQQQSLYESFSARYVREALALFWHHGRGYCRLSSCTSCLFSHDPHRHVLRLPTPAVTELGSHRGERLF